MFEYCILNLLGLATLLPWNVFISQPEYFFVRTHQPPTVSWLADGIETSIVIAFQLTNSLAILAIIPYVHRFSKQQLVVIPLCITLAVMALSAAGAALTGLSGRVLLGLTLGSSGLMGLTTALLQSGVFNVAAQLPPQYMQAVTIGMAIAGLAVSLLSGATLWAGGALVSQPTAASLRPEAVAYFGGSALVVAGALYAFRIFLSSQLWQRHCALQDSGAGEEGDLLGTPELPPELRRALLDTSSATARLHPIDQRTIVEDDWAWRRSKGLTWYETLADVILEESRVLSPWYMMKLLKWHSATLAMCFGVTLAAFPALTSASCSTRSSLGGPTGCQHSPDAPRIYGDLWVPLLFVVFNAGDVAGRVLVGRGLGRLRGWPGPRLFTYSVLRLVLLLCMAFCRVATPHPWRLPALLRADAFPLALNLLLGLTNGHLATMTSMHMPDLLPRQYRIACGPIMAGFMTLGLTVGSVVSSLLLSLLQAH